MCLTMLSSESFGCIKTHCEMVIIIIKYFYMDTAKFLRTKHDTSS